jgi:hypothetical protein
MGQFQPDLAQIIFGGRGFKFIQNEGDCPSPRGDNSESVKTLKILKNLLLQDQQAKFNQTWYKLSLGEGDLVFFK